MMMIQTHNPICLTQVQQAQPHSDKSAASHDDGDFAKLLSQSQPSPKAHDAPRPPSVHAPAPAPAPSSAPPCTTSTTQAEAQAHDAASPEKPSPAARQRGSARAQPRRADADHACAHAAHSARPGSAAESAADAHKDDGAALDSTLMNGLATPQLPGASLPVSPPAPFLPTAAVEVGGKATPVALQVVSNGASASDGLSITPTDGVGENPTQASPAIGGSTTQRSAASDSMAAAERDDASARDLVVAQLTSQVAELAMARAEPSLAQAGRDMRAQAVDATAGPAGIAGAHFAPGPNPARDMAAPVPVTLQALVTSPEFQQALGVQVSVLARDGVQHAELQLNPADMGPVSVHIVLDGTQASVEFGADMATTRQAIETGLPELASALRDAGLTLSGGGVSQHSRGRGDAGSRASEGRDGSARSHVGSADEPASRQIRRTVSAGGVDLYA